MCSHFGKAVTIDSFVYASFLPETHLESTDCLMKKTVLIVDDERLIADSMAILLNRSGEFEATACYSLFEALEEGRKLRPDLALFDVMRPRSNGVADACRLRTALKCPVLLMSGAAVHDGEVQCPPEFEGGAFQILSKPILPADLLRQLKSFAETGSIEMARA